MSFGTQSKGDLSLETVDDLRQNEYVIPGDAEASHLVDIITPSGGEPPQMPPEGQPLTGTAKRTQRIQKPCY